MDGLTGCPYPGHGKSWDLGRPFSRPGRRRRRRKFICRNEQSWKIAKVVESHGKVMKNDDNVMEFLLQH